MYHVLNADFFIVGKENIIMTGTVQQKLPFLIFQKDGEEAFYVCPSFQLQGDGGYRGRNRFTKMLCETTDELRDMTVSQIESVVISSWKAGRRVVPKLERIE